MLNLFFVLEYFFQNHSDRGTRTWFSDDYLFLPLAVCHYLDLTNEFKLLDDVVPFATGVPRPKVGEESVFDRARVSDKAVSVYEHCKRAIQYGWQYGAHGLPLIRVGDWCDGMNMVGIQHKGESVWVGFFIHYVMEQFLVHATRMNDQAFITDCNQHMEKLRSNLAENAWDGEWYIRAFYDNGKPLGSKVCDEAKIDSLPQSWAVISGVGDPDRAKRALDSVDRLLVRRQPHLRLIQLLDPPFEHTTQEPGYIKSYAAGIRENGAQYTHAALWVIWAYSMLGDSPKAWELLDLINPINHTQDDSDLYRYRGEPYVMAADVYIREGHEGQAGWTWYTGSAGWCYRLVLEQLLGRLSLAHSEFMDCVLMELLLRCDG